MRHVAAGDLSHPDPAVPRLLFVEHHARDFLQQRIELARTLRKAGFDVHVAVPGAPSLEEVSRQGFPVHIIYLRRKSARPVDELRCGASLIALYRRLRPTLVHHIGVKPTLYGGLAARIVGVPAAVSMLAGLGHLFTASTVTMRVLRGIVTRGLRSAFRHQNHRLILQNPDDRNHVLASGILPDHCAVLIKGSGIDLSLFTPEPEPPGPVVVLMASRLLWQKGVLEFVAAARALRGRGSRARFLLLGEPDPGHPSAVPLPTLERWDDFGDVEWLGWKHDMPRMMAQSHVVCLPSFYGEGVPRVLLEAAASGRAIVTTDSPGCREVVRHGENGLLVPARDSGALGGAIAQLIGDAPLRAAMGRRGREIVVNEFSLDRVIEANLTLYRSLLASLPGLESVVTALAVGTGVDVGPVLAAPDTIGNGGVRIPGPSIDI